MSREEVIRQLEKEKLLLVTRGIYDEELLKLAEAMQAGGIRIFEITYNQKDPDTLETTSRNMKMLKERFGDSLTLGTGTVLTVELVRNAKECGAQFIVSPSFDEEVVRETLRLDMMAVPGCMTPTEIVQADKAGADFIKLFPAGTLGFKYCRDIMAPLNHVRYLATVGINEETFRQYLELGFAAAGVSSYLVDKNLRKQGNWVELTERAKRLVAIAQEYTG